MADILCTYKVIGFTIEQFVVTNYFRKVTCMLNYAVSMSIRVQFELPYLLKSILA